MTKKEACGSMATRQALRMLGVSEAEMPHMRHMSLRRLVSDCRRLRLSRMLQSGETDERRKRKRKRRERKRAEWRRKRAPQRRRRRRRRAPRRRKRGPRTLRGKDRKGLGKLTLFNSVLL